ncbi:MAG: metallophosphoesterase [Candidatus Bathyarchaeota archaeon]|nr:MAG: metallophosphoesterase [Candidatus Bathyarchaeota archaeon]
MLTPVQPYPALVVRGKHQRLLVIADLHIGWEVALAQEGVYIPSQTPRILSRLQKIVKMTKPTRLIILGDVKHTVAKVELREWQDIPNLFETLEKSVPNIQVVPGNHDGNLEPLLPEAVNILPVTGVKIGDVGLFHGHAWPTPELLGCRTLIMGHIHPTVAFRDPFGYRITAQVWAKIPCNKTRLAQSVLKALNIKEEGSPSRTLKAHFNVAPATSQLLILPCFNEFLGGRPVNRTTMGRRGRYREFVGPILRSKGAHSEDAEIHLLDGTFLGTISQLKTLG